LTADLLSHNLFPRRCADTTAESDPSFRSARRPSMRCRAPRAAHEAHVKSQRAPSPTSTDVHWPVVLADLERVEARLRGIAHSSREPRMTEITQHLIGAGGKRIRPTAALLVFYACGDPDRPGRRDDMTDVATALELIHSATLLHDDIIDGSDLRRGRESALRRFGMADTLVAGDFVFSQAFALCARFEERIVRWAADACIRLTEGEMLQGRLRRDPNVTVGDYDEIIARKTASLFEVGGRTAAYLAGAEDGVQGVAAELGHHIGMAFQIIDDLLDVDGASTATGKPAAADLRDGNPSLPIVLAMQHDPEIRALFTKQTLDDSEIAQVIERIRATGALATARERAEAHVGLALDRIAALPNSEMRAPLRGLTERILTRSG
jgi:octaprenyl-diphosphate synthase